MPNKKSPQIKNYEPVIHILGIIIVLLFLVNFFYLNSLSSSLTKKLAESKEAARPANIELIIIKSTCTNCFNIDKVVQSIKAGNVKITKEEILNEETAKAFIQQYDLKKLPTVIVKGEINKTDLASTLNEVKGAFVFASQTPPYYDLTSKKVKGVVKATVIEASACEECTNLTLLIDQISRIGVVFSKVDKLSETEGKDFMKQYNITKLPTLIFSEDALEYPEIKEAWKTLGTQEQDTNLVLRTVNPPYKNLATGKIEGLTSVIYLTDSSCKECYDVKSHLKIIQGYGVKLINETTFDVATKEGLKFVNEYNIKLVPTIVMSKEVKAYESFYAAYQRVSKELDDGSTVFTSLELMGSYKDLATGKVVTPKPQTAEQ